MATRILFIDENYIKDSSSWDANIDSKTLVNSIWEMQEERIKSLLGSNLYSELITDVDNGTLSGDNQTLLVDYVKPCLAKFSMYYVLNDLVFQFKNGGIVKHKSDNAEIITEKELTRNENRFLNSAERLANNMILFLNANLTKYPSYLNPGNDIDTVHPANSGYSSGLYLPDLGCFLGDQSPN